MADQGLAQPHLEGTFLQLAGWMLGWTDEQWDAELGAMQEAGMTTVIIQYCGADGRAFYPSATFEPFAPEVAADPVGTILEVAHRRTMGVFLGLHSTWDAASAMTDGNTRMGEELLARYGDRPAFGGWYIPQEAANTPALDSEVVETYAATTAWCRDRTPGKPVGIAPYFGLQPAPDDFHSAWRQVLDRIGVDILMLQDGVGCDRHLDPVNVEPYFAAMARACQETSVEFWDDLEVFRIPRDWQPAPIDEVRAQIEVARPYCRRIVIFEFSHYMSPQRGPRQKQLYDDYLRHVACLGAG